MSYHHGTAKCDVCGQGITYYDPDANSRGGWWSHWRHPGDEHDAVPREGTQQ